MTFYSQERLGLFIDGSNLFAAAKALSNRPWAQHLLGCRGPSGINHCPWGRMVRDHSMSICCNFFFAASSWFGSVPRNTILVP